VATPSPAYDDLRCFCLFVGPNRSGSSLVGALLDAHANALVAHELDAFEDRGSTGRLAYATREELFDDIARNSGRAARKGRKGRRRGGNVSYAVPGRHQGTTERLHVIGTKRANRTMVALDQNPRALQDLQEQVGIPLRLVHLVRNPFDNIASMTPEHEPEMRVERYVSLQSQVRAVKEAGWPVHDVFLEEVIAEPDGTLGALCAFLELEAGAEYLRDCARIVLDAPNESRHGRDWTPQDLGTVNELMGEIPWLGRYVATEIR